VSAPLVTTVIATYRRPDLVRRAIRSALGQSLPEVRVAVYDNASGDETGEVVRALQDRDGRVTYHRHASNIGASANYNYGLSRVDTPYFSLLGDDDVLLPGLYKEAVKTLERHPECQFFCARTIVDNRNAGVLQHRGAWPAGVYEPSAAVTKRMIEDHFINTAVVFRRSMLESAGYFDHLGSDRNYIVLAAARHPFAVTERELGVMTVHDRSFSGGGTTTDFGSGTEYSWGARYVIESHEELARRLADMPWTAGERELLMETLRRQTRRELIYVSVTAPDAARAAACVRETRAAAPQMRFGFAARAALATAAGAMSVRPAARALHAAASRLWRLTKRVRAADSRDGEVRDYLAALDSGDNRPAGA